MNNKTYNIELKEKIMEGIKLAVQKLKETAKKNNEELVISKDGKVVKIKANEL